MTNNQQNELTMVELQNILARNILKLNDEDVDTQENAANIATALATFKGAKAMISNMSVILRAKELIADGKLKDTATVSRMIGK